jgi:CTP:phosphocholine cytidylyltransferase-like protein
MKSDWEIDDVKIIENQGWKETSEIEALRLALNILPNLSNILIVMGDLYFQKDSLGFLEFGKSSINYQVEDNQDIGLNFDIGKDNRLNGLGFDLKAKWSGLCYMTGKELEILKKFCSPKNCRMEVWEFFKYAIKNFGNIKCCPDNGKCVRINTRDKMREICAG